MVSAPQFGPHPELTTKQINAIARCLSDPRRFEILQKVAGNSCTACSDLRTTFLITAPTLSHHLKELESVGLIDSSRRGKFMDITFHRETWNAYLAALQKI